MARNPYCRRYRFLSEALRGIADGAIVAETPVDADDWTRTWSGIAPPTRYLRAELIQHNPVIRGWMMLALGNAVFFG